MTAILASRAPNTGRAHALQGLVRAEQAHPVRVVFQPDDGGTALSTEPISLEAGDTPTTWVAGPDGP